MIERTKDGIRATIAAVLSMAAAWWWWQHYGFEALGAFGIIAAIGGSIWVIVYTALGAGVDDPRTELLERCRELLINTCYVVPAERGCDEQDMFGAISEKRLKDEHKSLQKEIEEYLAK